MKVVRCILKEGKEKPIQGRHPWIFSGAIDEIEDCCQTGDLVKVYSRQNQFLGVGYLNPRSQIAIRMLAFEDIKIDEHFFERRIREALSLRADHFGKKRGETNAYRLIHSEGDFLPGLIVDRYADYLVVQFLTAGMEAWKPTIIDILQRELAVKGIFEKDDSEWRGWEGLEKRVGKLTGEEPPDFVEILENGYTFVVDIHGGQKTGFFLDQRENRRRLGEISQGKRVLNGYAYTGGFSVYAAKNGTAETVSVDSSKPALNTAKVNLEKNGLSLEKNTLVHEDVSHYLRSVRQEFDIIVLDPPAFAKSKHQVQQAARGYKDINLQALKRLAPRGCLFTFSCSSFIEPDLFQKIVFSAAKDARRDVRIIAKTSHAFDHPINIYHPEGEYLKGLLCLTT